MKKLLSSFEERAGAGRLTPALAYAATFFLAAFFMVDLLALIGVGLLAFLFCGGAKRASAS